jgi:hypothetical protein
MRLAVTNDGGILSKMMKGGCSRMAETPVLGGRRRSGDENTWAGWRGGKLQCVEGAGAITSQKSVLGAEILHRNAKRVKFN